MQYRLNFNPTHTLKSFDSLPRLKFSLVRTAEHNNYHCTGKSTMRLAHGHMLYRQLKCTTVYNFKDV